MFTANPEKADTKIFSEKERKYIRQQVADKKKLITVNQFTRTVFIQTADKEKTTTPQSREAMRKNGDTVCGMLNKIRAKTVSLSGDGFENQMLDFAEGLMLGNYQFLKYKSKKEKNSLGAIKIKSSVISESELKNLNTIVEATCIARDLVNEPPSFLTATQLANEFVKLGSKGGFGVTVYDKPKIEEMKMGGLLGVNRGSIEPPTFTVMEYKPATTKNKKPYILVGKGVVYDTGGLSLKPTPNSMDYMKCDMGGSAAVACAIYAIAKNKLPLHVVALVPATDNRPGGDAYTPGDVLTMYSGKTVEVLNTDAEGRLILADALHYAKQYKPELVMEFSTLTGSAANALGKFACAFLSTASDEVKAEAFKSANNVFERMVEFPMWEEYGELMKSDVADIKNIGGPAAGMITAAKFLENFIDYPYMHFDIAGTAFLHATDSYRGKNGTGTGVRFIVDFLSNMVNQI